MQQLNPSKIIAPVVLTVFVLGGLLLSRFMSPVQGWGFLLVALLGLFFVGQPRLLLFAVWVWYTFGTLVGYYTRTAITKYMDELIFLLLTGILIVTSIRRRALNAPVLRVPPMSRALRVLIISALFSLPFTGADPLRLIHFVKSYLIFPLFFYMALQFLRPQRDVRFVMMLITAYYIFQFMLNIGWLLRINPIRNPNWSVNDFSVGTLGGCNLVAYLSIMVFYACYALFNQSEKPKLRIAAFFMALLCLFQIFITYTVHAYLLLAIGVGLFYVLFFRQIRNKALPVAAAVCMIALFAFFETHANTSKTDLKKTLFESGGLSKRFENMWNGPKGSFYRDAFWHIPSERPVRWLIGAGPGQYMTAPALIRPTPLTLKYLGEWYFTFSGQQQLQIGSVLSNPLNGMCALFGELGLIGFAAYLFMYIFPMVHISRQCAKKQYVDVLQRSLAQAFIPAMVTFLMLAILYDAWNDLFFVISLWIWAALAWEPIRQNDQVQKAEAGDHVSLTANNTKPVNQWTARPGLVRETNKGSGCKKEFPQPLRPPS